MHVSLAQYLHREDLVKAAEHSTDPDQEACPHHGLIRMDPGATDKSVDLRSAAWNTLDNEESFRMTTEDSENLWVSMSLKIKHVCLPLAKSLPFIPLHRKRGRQSIWIYIYLHIYILQSYRKWNDSWMKFCVWQKSKSGLAFPVEMTCLWLKFKATHCIFCPHNVCRCTAM